ncbi:MAG TPA: spermidine/putrescine ABC transporter substrate-binding protein [Actinomycetota bacterium]|nr:spermidine/putrescine ABC transporter substrate-binding protein [Actinomycetota bacterium]
MSDSERMLDPSRMQEILRARLTRRGFLRGAGTGAVGISLGALLAACAEEGTTDGQGPTAVSPEDVFDGEIETGAVNFANWPLYIDKSKDAEGNRIIPSVLQFKDETGIEVNYTEDIQDNQEFFGKIQPQLAAGQDTGYDIIVITNGPQFSALVRNNWVWPLDTTKRPNFDANAAAWAKDPIYDVGNKYSMAWQSGVTGIAVNMDRVNGEVKTLSDLADPAKVGKESVGMLRSDMPDFVMINLGIDPKTSGEAEWQEAADWLAYQRDQGVVRQYYTQNYTDDMTAGNVSVTMAWSGDVLYYNLWLHYDGTDPELPNLQFVLPEAGPDGPGGALLWIDNMLIPAEAAHPDAALATMDYYYRPDVATMVTEWVLYMSPVPQTQELILKDAEKAYDKGWKGYGNKLTLTADSDYLYPSDEFLGKTSFGREFETDEEYNAYLDIFSPIWQGE